MEKSLHTFFNENNCKKINGPAYCVNKISKKSYDKNENSYLGLTALTIASKEFNNIVSSDIRKTSFKITNRLLYYNTEDKILCCQTIDRYGDCISGIKIKLFNDNKEVILTDYIDDIWLNISGSKIPSDNLEFNGINYNNPINFIGLVWSDINLIIQFNNIILNNHNISCVLDVEYLYLSNSLRCKLAKMDTTFTYSANDYIIKNGMLIKKNDIIFDDFKLFSTKIIEPIYESYIIILTYSKEGIFVLPATDKKFYLSILQKDKCYVDFNKYFTYGPTEGYFGSKYIFIKFHSKNTFDDYVKIYTNLIFCILEF